MSSSPPDTFHVVALTASHNEADIIIPSLRRLIDQAIQVYVLDDWSSDGTYEQALSLVGEGVIAVERFPAAPSGHFEWSAILRRKEQLVCELDADWFINHDVDEILVPPWPGVSLREGLWLVDRAGYDCVDHLVATFPLTDYSFAAVADFEAHFRHFTLDYRNTVIGQVKAWKNAGRPVDLHSSGGHQARFDDRRLFPELFLLKHYPLRSLAQARAKLADRSARWSPAERERGWHRQYDHKTPDSELIEALEGLAPFDEDRACQLCLEHSAKPFSKRFWEFVIQHPERLQSKLGEAPIQADPAPLNILAIICVRNGEAYVARCLEHVIANGIDVVLIDHQSTDSTREWAEPYLGYGLREIRELPFDGTFSLTRQLEMKQRIAEEFQPDWSVHLDVDEVLESPTEDETLRQAIERCDARSMEAIHFDEFVFLPSAEHGLDHYDYYAENLSYYHFQQPTQPIVPRRVRAWRAAPARSNIDAAGDVVTNVPDEKVARGFVLRHYAVLGQRHAEAKYLGRIFDESELARGWHRNRLGIRTETLANMWNLELKQLPSSSSKAFDRSDAWPKHFWELDAEQLNPPFGPTNQVDTKEASKMSGAVAKATITADKRRVSVPVGQPASVTIEWDSAGETGAEVWVSVDGGAESKFAARPNGSQVADWIVAPHTYTFNLYGRPDRQSRLASVTVIGLTKPGSG